MKCLDLCIQNLSKPENSRNSEMFMNNVNVGSLMPSCVVVQRNVMSLSVQKQRKEAQNSRLVIDLTLAILTVQNLFH